ncbi:methylenetetrahydrofolate reductase [NAD(P)H] [Nakamurella lactea]|uniref:methylenetetrahydrofolate reductase [NAD(P)H] n=1 Tax=Nakamurella lactea TaxID=459515 RepID=UPI0004043039|nr:methylenetetrahydrofolate reductase [NAD(P)H] [Nakamurella lactea]
MPTVRERLSAPGRKFSLEFMPPRSDDDEAGLWLAVRQFEGLRPAFVSVTYGAGGSHRDRTIRVTGRIARETTLLPVAHLTAVGHSVEELRHVIGSYAAVGVHNLLALRGDPPGDPTADWVAHPQGLEYASELVALIRSLGDFTVGVAAFPEKHPRSPDIETDTKYYVDKVSAGADYGITQMLFSADDYLNLRDRVTAAGADVPLLPGIMPVTSFGRLMRICELSGQSVPVDLAERLAAAPDARSARAIGVEHAIRMGEQLLAADVPALHFYTFNRASAIIEVLRALDMVPGPNSGTAALPSPATSSFTASRVTT